MYFADCPYLVPSKAPTGWKEDPNVRKTVDDALMDSKVQAQVKKNIDAGERIAKAASISANNATPNTLLSPQMPLEWSPISYTMEDRMPTSATANQLISIPKPERLTVMSI